GQWPSVNPPLSGRILDEPNTQELARRLRTFLEREVSSDSPISEEVRAELKRLGKRLKSTQVKDMARELQVENNFRNAKHGIEQIVFRLTGQRLSGKKPRASRREPAKADLAAIRQYTDELRNLLGDERLEQRVKELVGQLTGPNLKALAESLGTTRKARRKEDWNEILLAAVKRQPAERRETTASESKVARLTEIVNALKAKADGPDAPLDEIEAELRSLEEQMDHDEAIALAKQIGVVRHLNSRHEAIEEIRRKVFEMKRTPESIAH
ncbi:MAG: hypothetical protein ACRELF_21215, partial [Gemmataceae bacterium]